PREAGFGPVIAAALDEAAVRAGMHFKERNPADAGRLAQSIKQLLYTAVPVAAGHDLCRGMAYGVQHRRMTRRFHAPLLGANPGCLVAGLVHARWQDGCPCRTRRPISSR